MNKKYNAKKISSMAFFFAMLPFIVGEHGTLNVKLIMAVVTGVILLGGCVFFIYRRFFWGIILMLILLIIVGICILDTCINNKYYNNYLIMSLPILFILFSITSYIIIMKLGNKEQIRVVKRNVILMVVIMVIMEICLIHSYLL
jgi:hypothetical protein